MSQLVARGLRALSRVLDLSLSQMFDLRCVGCDAPALEASPLCAECTFPHPVVGELCQRCGTPVPHPALFCGTCIHWPERLLQVRSEFWLQEPQTHWLHCVKYGRWHQLLARYPIPLDSLSEIAFSEECRVVPVPLHPERWMERGFNQAELLARRVATLLQRPLLAEGLKRSGSTQYQARLGRKHRDKNVRGRFQWNPRLVVPKEVLVVDDVFTTGATLMSCVRSLKRAGVERIYGWTLFRAPGWR